jgi:hypothetical protein
METKYLNAKHVVNNFKSLYIYMFYPSRLMHLDVAC